MKRTAPVQKRDPLGRRLCRMPSCLKPVPKGRLSYCSAECATAFEIAYFPSRTRWHVWQRDKGVCARCGCDTDKLERVFEWAARIDYAHGYGKNYDYPGGGRWSSPDFLLALWRELGFSDHWSRDGERWQADHVHECVRGGWGLGLENFRTLCTPCHKQETARLARELAEERRGHVRSKTMAKVKAKKAMRLPPLRA